MKPYYILLPSPMKSAINLSIHDHRDELNWSASCHLGQQGAGFRHQNLLERQVNSDWGYRREMFGAWRKAWNWNKGKKVRALTANSNNHRHQEGQERNCPCRRESWFPEHRSRWKVRVRRVQSWRSDGLSLTQLLENISQNQNSCYVTYLPVNSSSPTLSNPGQICPVALGSADTG